MRALLDEQFPWLAERELGRRYTLGDHMTVRIGDDYGAIFPRSKRDDALYARTADLLQPVARAWSFPASFPIATGLPGHGYPYHWVIVEWFTAATAAVVPLIPSSAHPLGVAMRQLHVSSPAVAPINPCTGVGLPAVQGEFEWLLTRAEAAGAESSKVVASRGIRALFEAGAAQPIDVSPTWTHGRLEPRAVLSDQGMFAGIGLWHNFGAGDPAQDLGVSANLLTLEMREDFITGYGDISEATAARALAYQLYSALRFIESGEPFLSRTAWDRLSELGLVHAA